MYKNTILSKFYTRISVIM